MANDGSLASLTEEWIAEQIRALAEFPSDSVVVFEGSTNPDGAKLIAEFTAHRSPYVVVLFEDDAPRPLDEGEQAYDPTYGIYIVVQSKRPGAARKGDGTTPGTNMLRSVLRVALHDKYPAIGEGGFYTDRTEFQGVRVVFQRKDAFILRAGLVVRESPTA